MYALGGSVLQRARLLGTRFFYRFGIHCATHQIRLILVSSVVITSLLFPAIAIYYSSQTQYFSGFTLRVLDSFLTPDDISSYFAQRDLQHLWEGDSALRVRGDSVARARCGMEGILREERVLVGAVSPEDVFGALDKNTLLATLQLERRIAEAMTARGIPCLRTRQGSCFSLSPSAFWDWDERALLADDNILDTLNLSPNVSVSGVPITPEMVLAGRELRDPTSNHFDAATFLVLTYFFPETDCFGKERRFQWLHALEDAGGSAGELVVLAQEPHLIALEYQKNVSLRSRFSVLSFFPYLAYSAFAIYCFRLFRRLNMVHSRLGLAFTGIVEIVVSTITSVSVCALVGFRVTMVPWEVFPIIVLFIGVENMCSIVDAVVRTSISLPVKERIAQGLSHAGTSNTLKVVSYNAVLGVIAGLSTGAIRQFCAFSIVVLVAHWFLVHTFFVTVVSIDIQRLELDELLRQNASLTPTVITDPRKATAQPSKSKAGSLWATLQGLIRGRPAKNISLLLLLAITATLYYATSPQAVGSKQPTKPHATRNPLSQLSKTHNAAPDDVSPAQRVWQTLNPSGDPLIHIRLESPTILVLGQSEHNQLLDDLTTDTDKHTRPRFSRVSRLWTRTVRPVVWLLKFFVMPITVTTVVLYGILLYLLKDAELLEAQRHAAEPESPPAEETSSVEDSISFNTLPRAFATDVDLIATSRDGKVIATVGLQNEFVIWRTDTQSHVAVDTSNFLLGASSTPSASTTLTAIAVNDTGDICAVGTGSGAIAVFLIGKDQIKPLPLFHLDHLTSGTTAIYFTGSLKFAANTASRRAVDATELSCHLYAAYENGAVVEWDILSATNPHYVTPSRAASVVKSMLLPIQADGRLLVGFCLDDGVLELCNVERANPVFAGDCAISAGNPADLVSRAHICSVELDGAKRIIVGAATQAGAISLWDLDTRECLFILEGPFGNINSLKISPVNTATCTTCGELPMENFSITFSVGHIVQFYRAYLTLPTRRCSCPRNLPQQAPRSSLLTLRSRSGSSASVGSGTNTPRVRSRMPSVSTTPPSDFPVSGHGVHSRRASEKDGLRRTSETFFLNNADYYEYDAPIGPQDVTPASSFLASHPQPSIWQSLVVVRVADATVERGSWDVGYDKIVGIRRRPRPPLPKRTNHDPKTQLLQEHASGLSPASLERWELWTFDPAEGRLQASPLIALSHDTPSTRRRVSEEGRGSRGGAAPAGMPRRKGVVPRLHFTRVAPFLSTPGFCVAGFGNTVGLFRFHCQAGKPVRPSKPPKESRHGSAKVE
ncbi:sterol regulatory element binding protein cleavage-activating protein [Trametes versicolor FP-101664 SS1]|uniref:sterol regulatory element binding protein cleavage-activating protein n=1 Tax=Trametes versicolor (strain FP-101664) TaxID=717944 RepID=UPI000462399B|nr:sterol regulatory element binding protein cleavage-activating protein [Trametes versicolor FP-101664 SS1]EIW60861.1 sterol regulatory element binding protein cleavage-activating protein [Trametes versicolor FP-101664 SS1]